MGADVELLSLADIGFVGDIDEYGKTCNENAKIKAVAVREFCKQHGIDIPVIAEDTGLFVPALGGEPGVKSARSIFSFSTYGVKSSMLSTTGMTRLSYVLFLIAADVI